jgi:predicted protein tyrosine phosphatase
MTILVCPLDQVERVVREHAPTRVVSLLSPGDAPPLLELPAPRRLHLAFNDIAEPAPGLIHPSGEHIRALMDFVAAGALDEPLLIHCWAGVSRSTAAAYLTACQRAGPGHERTLAERLRAAAPFATPNLRMIALGDEALRRGGAMVQAIAAIGRGSEDALPAPFVL